MLDKIKDALQQLNSVLTLLTANNEKVEEESVKLDNQKKKLEEKEAGYKGKDAEFNERETKIKNIESIVKATENAKKLMAEAKTLMANAEERQKIQEGGFKKLAKDRASLEKDKQDFQISNKKQVEALKKERGDFDAKLKATKVISAALK